MAKMCENKVNYNENYDEITMTSEEKENILRVVDYILEAFDEYKKALESKNSSKPYSMRIGTKFIERFPLSRIEIDIRFLISGTKLNKAELVEVFEDLYGEKIISAMDIENLKTIEVPREPLQVIKSPTIQIETDKEKLQNYRKTLIRKTLKEQKPHKIFTREGLNLYCWGCTKYITTIPADYLQSLTGNKTYPCPKCRSEIEISKMGEGDILIAQRVPLKKLSENINHEKSKQRS